MIPSSLMLAFFFGLAAGIGWPAVIVVFLLVVLIGTCGLDYSEQSPNSRRLRVRVRRFTDRR